MKDPLVVLMSKVVHDPETGCWKFTGCDNGQGYGSLSVNKIRDSAHRWAYQILVGPIPEHRVVHHTCRNRRCCNPAHLELTTPSAHPLLDPTITNQHKQKTHCKRGHEFTEENTYLLPRGRACKECKRLEKAERYAREHPDHGPHNSKKTHCKHGHEFTPENTQYSTQANGIPRRSCRICRREIVRRHRKL